MDVEALRWFQQVADGTTVTEVGEMFWVTQSGVSRGLARLEDEVGTPLLRRSGRTLRMTHAGAVFKRYVDAALQRLDDGLAAVTQLIDPETGTVAVAAQLSLGTWMVPALIRDFRVEHPGIHFELQQARDELVSAVLGAGPVDLEITALRPTERTVRWQHLLSEPLFLLVSAGHPLSGRGKVALDVVAEEPFVVLRRASLLRRQGTELCERAGFAPSVGYEVDDLPTLRGMIAAGLGVGIAPAPGGAGPGSVVDGVAYLPIDDPLARRDVGLAWSTERRLLPAAEMFREYVIAHAASTA